VRRPAKRFVKKLFLGLLDELLLLNIRTFFLHRAIDRDFCLTVARGFEKIFILEGSCLIELR
jgi:hypothetical protein